MTAAAGAALSHIPSQGLPDAILRANQRWQIDRSDRQSARVAGHRHWYLFRPTLHGAHARLAGTPDTPGHPSSTRITCSNLVFTDEDFVRLYYQVMGGK
jgi:hypothetical protein